MFLRIVQIMIIVVAKMGLLCSLKVRFFHIKSFVYGEDGSIENNRDYGAWQGEIQVLLIAFPYREDMGRK